MKDLIDKLHPLERSLISFLKNGKSVKELSSESGLKEIEVTRAIQWLENKNVLKIKSSVKEVISLDKNGEKYLKEGLPERKFLESLKGEMGLDKLQQVSGLDKNEVNISLGLLKKKGCIGFDNGLISITETGKGFLSKTSLEEKFFSVLPLEIKELSDEEKYAFNELKKRKQIVKVDMVKEKVITLTKRGKELSKLKLKGKYIESLTPAMLKSGYWKGKKFRKYDVSVNVPKVYAGKRHFVKEANNLMKKIWVEMGFKEMTGDIVNSGFWNFDALFTAQDHPVREMHDTFFVKSKSKLPKLSSNVKKMHEDVWGYKWDAKEAEKTVLRTHTTVLSAKTLAELKEFPAKFFALGRNYRNEALDWCHLFELNQTEGIVVDEGANFRHLLGYLKQFFSKMGYEKVRFRPAYFPYTEPSVEIDVYVPEKGTWMELGGAGIFRPEVVIPLLGKWVPVLAWGPGSDRILMGYYGLKDIRDLFKNDLKQLKEMKCWV